MHFPTEGKEILLNFKTIYDYTMLTWLNWTKEKWERDSIK